MFKYIFCLIAILMQPIFAFLVFHKQEKQKAALKMPLVYLSGVYLVSLPENSEGLSGVFLFVTECDFSSFHYH